MLIDALHNEGATQTGTSLVYTLMCTPYVNCEMVAYQNVTPEKDKLSDLSPLFKRNCFIPFTPAMLAVVEVVSNMDWKYHRVHYGPTNWDECGDTSDKCKTDKSFKCAAQK